MSETRKVHRKPKVTAQLAKAGRSGHLRDVLTKRKNMAAALRFSEERYRALFRDNPTMIVTLDADLTILSANPVCAGNLGYTVEELEGSSVLKLFHEDDRPAVAGQLQACLQNPNRVNRWQFRKICKDGSPLWVEETAQAVYDLNGELNLLVVCQDVTERRRAEEALRESEERFRATFHQAAVGIGHVTPDGRWLRVNRKYCDVVGYTEEELKALTVGDITHPDDLDASMWQYQLLLEGKLDHYSLEKRYIRKDGSTIWVNLTASMVFDAGGKPIFAVGVVEDISKRKRAEEAMRESENRYRTLFNAIDEGFCIIEVMFDKDEKPVDYLFLETNPSFEKQTGLIDVQGRKMRELAPQYEELWFEKYGEIALTGQPARFQDFAAQLNRWYDVYAFRFGHPEKRHVAILFSDITERKGAEEEIKKLNVSLAARAADLEYANQELEAFNYSVAHDLRNPLNVISLCCQALQELCVDSLDEQCAGYIQDAYDGTLRMTRLIESLLNFSRLAHAELHRDRVDLSRMAGEVAGELKGTETGHREFRIAVGISADGDAALLRVVLDNLFGNAWKYTASQEEALIEFDATTIDERTVYFVRDNGKGFNMTDADKLFVPFQRLPGAETCKGFGIGLATVERIIRRHGGRVWAEGAPGRGATFYFTLSAD